VPGQLLGQPRATSTAEWTGVRLGDVLAAAGLRPDTGHVAFAAPTSPSWPTRRSPTAPRSRLRRHSPLRCPAFGS